MKKINFIPIAIILACLSISTMFSSCLKLQKDYNRKTNVDTLDGHLYKTAWAYLKSRAYGSNTDTIFRRMYDGIIYSGIDTNEYVKPNRTFILLNNTAVSGSVWAKYKNGTAVGKSWASYPKTDVKN